MNEIFIQVKRIGFVFLLDRRMTHNFIRPAFLSFFNPFMQKYQFWDNDINGENAKPAYDDSLAFPPDDLYSNPFKDTFHYVGRGLVLCSDSKIRRCVSIKFNFEYEGHSYSELFFIDKSMKEGCAILGSSFWRKINAT